jgi:hypothetical protein
VTYTLCKGITKTGKPRYFFAREPKGEPVDAIPAGYEIRESVNGIVSLAKARPKQLRPEEIEAVKSAIERHPRSLEYRVHVKGKEIVIYEMVGAGSEGLLAAFEPFMTSEFAERMRAERARNARCTPEMRFILEDEAQRLFRAERMCYRSSVDGWLPLYSLGTADIESLARRLVPTLGTDGFFELM